MSHDIERRMAMLEARTDALAERQRLQGELWARMEERINALTTSINTMRNWFIVASAGAAGAITVGLVRLLQ